MSGERRAFDPAGARVTVMGLGVFGGGGGVTRWLAERGADVLVTDVKPAEELGKSVAALEDLVSDGRVRLRLGEHHVSDFTTCDLVIANPAVAKPWENRFLRAAAAAGIPRRTEIGLLLERLPDPERVIGVTGSAGKSTTSAMIHHAITACGKRVVFGGNIGGSLLHELGKSLVAGVHVVLELSSFMLHWLHEEGWGGVRVACVTNVSPNHLDWHGTLEHYEESKRHLVRDLASGGTAILGPGLEAWTAPPGVRVLRTEERRVGGLCLPGAHNEVNAGMAALAARAACPDLSESEIERAIRGFAGLPHRLEFVGEARGVRYYNDSKCTTPDACLRGVAAFAEGDAGTRRVHLIAGGYDKGSDLTPVGRLAPELAGLYTIGKTGPTIAAAAGGRAIECGTLEAALRRASERARAGEVVLLSPACASWDQFENYEARGAAFRELARGMM